MTVEAYWLLTATTVIAAVAVCVATVAIRSVKRLSAQMADLSAVEAATPVALETTPTHGFEADFVGSSTTEVVSDFVGSSTTEVVSAEFIPRVVHGRVIVPPTQSQVLRTALGRPGVRLNVFVHGLARALRAENRDRIVALMRREYRHRRRERLRAGRQAVRMARPTSAPGTDRLHEHLLEPKPLSLTERMIGS